MEVQHAHGNKVGATFKGVPEALLWKISPGGQDLEGNPRLLDRLHECHCLCRVWAVHVISPSFTPIEPDEFLAQFFGRG